MSAPIAHGRLSAYARRLGFGQNTGLVARYLDALETLSGRHPTALLAELAPFFRRRRIGQQEYARYFMLPEERLLYGLWLIRYAIQHQHSALMFVARGAEPFQEAWDVWRFRLGRRYPLPDAFSLRICRGYPCDTEPDAEPTHFLSRSIISSLSDHEREGVVSRDTWAEVEQAMASGGLQTELDAYLRGTWGVRNGLHELIGSSPGTLESALVHLADFGIDRSYRRLIWRNRRSRLGTDGVAPLLGDRGCTVRALAAWVRRTNVDHFGQMFDEEDIANMEAGLSRLTDRHGVLPQQGRELISSVMRIHLNARLLTRLRHRTEHRARPLLNILLRSTRVGQLLGRSTVHAVISVDEASVSGTSLIASELAALSFDASLQHLSLNIAQRTPSTAAFLVERGVVNACAAGGIWPQEDLSHFYGGYYRGDLRYVAFTSLARRLWDEQQQVNPDRGVCRTILEGLNDRLRSLASTIARAVANRDPGGDVDRRYPIEVILSHIVKLHLRRGHPVAFECQKIVLDDDVLQMVSPLQCDFTGWFFLREMRQRAMAWLEAHQAHSSELHELQDLDAEVRCFELAQYFERLAARHEAGRQELQTAATGFGLDLAPSVTAFLNGEASFESLRTAFYERYQWRTVSTAVAT
jgi:hypothetical protein